VVSYPSGGKLLNLLHINITIPQYPTHYSPVGYGNFVDIVMHKNVPLPEFIGSDIVGSAEV
jgi:hypothetical protein